MYQRVLKPLLFLFNAERAHKLASIFLQLFSLPIFNSLMKLVIRPVPASSYTCMGIDFPSRLGLAAGFDKDAQMFRALSGLGFGFVEVGTVTPKPQPGNEKPRLFRLPADQALINRMGFNNQGVESMVRRLRSGKGKVIIGGNIGKNKVTPNESAFDDYKTCFEALFDHVDYFTVNVSSPNTPGLRELQEKEPLKDLLSRLQAINLEKAGPKPILLKIAPDMGQEQLDDVVEIIRETGIKGIIATNTTISRSGLSSTAKEVERAGQGGLSGQPLKERALDVVRYVSEKLGEDFVVIGVGGISDHEDAIEMIRAGANLVQIYTSFIYGGPPLLRAINRRLADLQSA